MLTQQSDECILHCGVVVSSVVRVCTYQLTNATTTAQIAARLYKAPVHYSCPHMRRSVVSLDLNLVLLRFGVMLYELLSHKRPWEDMRPADICGLVVANNRPTLDPEAEARYACLLECI